MAGSPKKYKAYSKVCDIIGQPAAEFADRIRQAVGERAETAARLVMYDPEKDRSYTVIVAAAGCDRAVDEEFLITLTEGAAAAGRPRAERQRDAAGSGPSASKRTLFKGRVQLSPNSQARAARGGRGEPARRPRRQSGGQAGRQPSSSSSSPAPGRPKSGLPGLSSIAGVCMLCAVAAAGGIAFYASYMSQTADHGTIEVIRAEIIDIDESRGGRFLDLELFATHTSCARLFSDVLGITRGGGLVLYEEGDGCDRHTGAGQYPGVEAYATSTGVHIVLSDFQRAGDDKEWATLEIVTDTASIAHTVRIAGAR